MCWGGFFVHVCEVGIQARGIISFCGAYSKWRHLGKQQIDRHKHPDQRGWSVTVHWGTKEIERARLGESRRRTEWYVSEGE